MSLASAEECRVEKCVAGGIELGHESFVVVGCVDAHGAERICRIGDGKIGGGRESGDVDVAGGIGGGAGDLFAGVAAVQIGGEDEDRIDSQWLAVIVLADPEGDVAIARQKESGLNRRSRASDLVILRRSLQADGRLPELDIRSPVGVRLAG